MTRETLLDFLADFDHYQGAFLTHHDGYRSRTYTYTEVAAAARAFAARLRDARIGKGDKVLFWSENRPEWIVALWGCLLEGAIAVPIDYRSSIDLVRRIGAIVQARILLAGDEVSPPPDITTWKLADIEWAGGPVSNAAIARDDIAEILFT